MFSLVKINQTFMMRSSIMLLFSLSIWIIPCNSSNGISSSNLTIHNKQEPRHHFIVNEENPHAIIRRWPRKRLKLL
jgi:hypothetical protein